MIEVDPFVNDKLINVKKEYKRILNRISLILIFWILLILFGLFVSSNHENIKSLIFMFGVISLAPFLIIESIIFVRLLKVKKEIKKLNIQKTIYDKTLSEDLGI